MKIKNLVIGVLKYAVGFGLLAYVIWKFWAPNGNNPGIKGLLMQMPDFTMLLIAAVCGVVAVGIQFYRWYLLVRALDLPFTLRNAFRLSMVGYFYNTFLPGSIGGDGVKSYFIMREQPDRKGAAFATVIVDRLLGLFGLLLFSSAVGGTCWFLGDARILANSYLQKIITVAGSLVVGGVVGWVILGFLPARTIEAIGRFFAKLPLGSVLSGMWSAIAMYRKRPRVIYLAVPLSALAHTLMVLAFHCAVRVYPAQAPGELAEHFVIAPIGFIAQAFIPVPGGVGGAEAVFGYLYTLMDRPEATGVIGRLTMRTIEWSLGLFGYLVFLRMKAELPTAPKE